VVRHFLHFCPLLPYFATCKFIPISPRENTRPDTSHSHKFQRDTYLHSRPKLKAFPQTAYHAVGTRDPSCSQMAASSSLALTGWNETSAWNSIERREAHLGEVPIHPTRYAPLTIS
jgi:hypothetical protein